MSGGKAERGYASALVDWAKPRLASVGDKEGIGLVATLCPEWTAPAKASSDVLALFGALVRLIRDELAEWASPKGSLLAAQGAGSGFVYKVGTQTLRVSAQGLLELWRFGIALDLPGPNDPAFEVSLVNDAQRWLNKEVQGAWRTAQRRSKTFAQAKQILHPAGHAQKVQARRVESALALLLSDEEIACTRADLATDWLQGVDLWWHLPQGAPHKGHPVALSLAMTRGVEQKKRAAQGDKTLWTPRSLADQLRVDIDAPDTIQSAAHGAWQALGARVDPEPLAKAIQGALSEMGKVPRGMHPAARVDSQLADWLRKRRARAFGTPS